MLNRNCLELNLHRINSLEYSIISAWFTRLNVHYNHASCLCTACIWHTIYTYGINVGYKSIYRPLNMYTILADYFRSVHTHLYMNNTITWSLYRGIITFGRYSNLNFESTIVDTNNTMQNLQYIINYRWPLTATWHQMTPQNYTRQPK